MKILSALLLSFLIGGNALALYPTAQDKRDIVINTKARGSGQTATADQSSQEPRSAAKPTSVPSLKLQPKSGGTDSFFDIISD
ncbi:MAG: hypothetical protein ACSHXK_08695 [Oceanococcus sp.]